MSKFKEFHKFRNLTENKEEIILINIDYIMTVAIGEYVKDYSTVWLELTDTKVLVEGDIKGMIEYLNEP